MQLKRLLPVALAAVAAAQDGDTPSLVEALRSNNSSLSALAQLINTLPSEDVEMLSNATNITLLAPNNEAIGRLLNSSSSSDAQAMDAGLVRSILLYHVLNGTYFASNLTESNGTAQFIPTMLTNETYTNVTGGQRVEAIGTDEDVVFYSALKDNSTVVEANLNFTGGTIHIIDRVLSVPGNISSTLRDANLTAALGAVQLADLGGDLSEARDITVFAPNNEAFARIASLGGELEQDQLQDILEYHVVEGRVLYSDMISNTTLDTLDDDKQLNITVIDGSVFVNNAEVIIQDVLVANGVVHVINNVLNPDNTTVVPDPEASTPAPAFTNGATASGGANPFTSGVEGPTTTAPVATGANPGAGSAGGDEETSSSEEAAMPMCTGAVGVAALFGAGVVAFNF